MSANQKKYFLAPHWDYQPDGEIRLGNIIPSPSRPVPALSQVTFEPPSQPPSRKQGVKWSKEQGGRQKYGIYAKFLDLIAGAGIDASTGRTKQQESLFEFDEIETTEFWPSEDYVAERMSDQKVAHFLKRLGFHYSVYMINGLKVVRGAVAKTTVMKGREFEIAPGVDTSNTGIPASFGLGMEMAKLKTETLEWDGSSDFVFAFRVVKITKRRSGARVEDHHKGAMHGASNSISLDGKDDFHYVVEELVGDGLEVVDYDENVTVQSLTEPFSY